MSGANVLFILTGSIAAYKACDVVSRLVQRGHRVRCVATAAARRFVGEATLEGLTGEPVRHDLFAAGEALDHIQLTRWADATVVCPATAHSLNRFAAGLGDDLAGALLLAHPWEKPLLFAPAMNPAMWRHPATCAAVARLTGWGALCIRPATGRTACGEEGEGRLAEPGVIVAAIDAALAKPARRLRVLITSGGTAEPVDGVRVLTNTSTGRTGAGLAEHFARGGHNVVLLRARHSATTETAVQEETFETFAELDQALTRLLGGEHFDAVIHAAAVGDFGIKAVVANGVRQPPGQDKLDSHGLLALELEPLPKLINQLRTRSRNPALAVVAFKLTRGATPEAARDAVQALLAAAPVDFVVHNDLRQRGPAPDDFPAVIHIRGDAVPVPCATRRDLAVALEGRLTQIPATP
jgi:phosphopantothenoylcysteine decarboxylase/phosphopantothenate--cysteine ligase